MTLTGDRLTLAVHLEGVSRPIRVAIPGDVRELRPGEQTVFELSRSHRPRMYGPGASPSGGQPQAGGPWAGPPLVSRKVSVTPGADDRLNLGPAA